MILRQLKKKDAPYMLEWMRDKGVVKDLKTDFTKKTIEDCCAFIEKSLGDKRNLNLAIASDADEYMGTVSLKDINAAEGWAEFAIAIRACAMGKGYSQFGMSKILQIGVEDYDLSCIYWCVSNENKRAVQFYEKQGYQAVCPRNEWLDGYGDQDDMRWFAYQRSEK